MGHDDGVLAATTFQLAGQSYRAELRKTLSWRTLGWRGDLQWVVTGAGRQWILPGVGKPTDTPDDLRERFTWRLLPQGDRAWRTAPA